MRPRGGTLRGGTLFAMTAKEQVLLDAPGWSEAQAAAALDAVGNVQELDREEIDRAIKLGYDRFPADPPDASVRARAEASIRADPW